MASYPAYSSYRKTGREWFPEIPTAWRDSKLRWISSRYSGGTPDKNKIEYWEDGSIPWLNSGAVNQGTITSSSELISVEGFKNSSAKWIPANALVMALAGQGKTKGMVAQTKIKTTCNQSMAAIVIDEENPRYIYWWLSSQYKNIRGLTSDEGRDGLNLDIVGGIRCPLPPIEEQLNIVQFLDYKTAQIDCLIAKKKILLDKLAEKRVALISHAVTKGLDPLVPMKNSEVVWLGEIPKHWKSISVRWLIRIGSGDFISNSDTEFECSEVSQVPVVGGNGIMAYSNKSNTQSNCIVIGRVGAHCGNVHFINEPSWVTDNALRVKITSEDVSAEFLICALKAIGLNDYANKNAQPLITGEMVKSKKIALPPAIEQRRICGHIDAIEAHITAQTKKTQSAIEKLREYRSALINNAVTGKIDVRNVFIPEINNSQLEAT